MRLPLFGVIFMHAHAVVHRPSPPPLKSLGTRLERRTPSLTIAALIEFPERLLIRVNYIPRYLYSTTDLVTPLSGLHDIQNSSWAMTRRFRQRVEAKSKTMGCLVKRRPLLPSSRMVSFSFSTIDNKSLTYTWEVYGL